MLSDINGIMNTVLESNNEKFFGKEALLTNNPVLL